MDGLDAAHLVGTESAECLECETGASGLPGGCLCCTLGLLLQRSTLRWLHRHRGALAAPSGLSRRNVKFTLASPLIACRAVVLVLGICNVPQILGYLGNTGPQAELFDVYEHCCRLLQAEKNVTGWITNWGLLASGIHLRQNHQWVLMLMWLTRPRQKKCAWGAAVRGRGGGGWWRHGAPHASMPPGKAAT